MKVYVVYEKGLLEHPEHNGMTGPLGEAEYMQAFTNSEKLLDEYMRIRKKKLFKVKKYKMSKKEYTKFCNNNALRELQSFELTTRSDDSPIDHREMPIIMTPCEYNTLSEAGQYFGCENITFNDSKLFKEKYRRALSVLEYDSIQRLMMSFAESMGMDYDLPNAFFDELSGYVAINAEYFKS